MKTSNLMSKYNRPLLLGLSRIWEFMYSPITGLRGYGY